MLKARAIMGYGSSWKLFGKMQLLSWNPSLFTTVQLQLIKSHLATLPFQRCLMVLENNDTLMNQTLTKKFSNRPQSQSNFDWAGRLKLAYVRLKMDNKQENRACFAECFLFLSRLRAVSLFSVVHRAKRETRKWPRAWLMARDGRGPRFARLAASPLPRACIALTKSEEKERLLAVYSRVSYGWVQSILKKYHFFLFLRIHK